MSQIYLIGAGPGSKELLTLGAYRVLQRADVVLYDRLVSKEILALIPESVELVYVGKLEGQQESTQAKIYQLFVRYVSASKQRMETSEQTLVRLKGGDPFVFGRGIEEWLFLRELGCEVHFLPGVSSAIAVPGLVGIPLTARGVSGDFCVVAAQGEGGREVDWNKYAQVDTLVVLMGVRRRVEIARALLASGRSASEPVAFIENGSCFNERVVRATLADVAEGMIDVSAPAVFVVGAVTKFCLEPQAATINKSLSKGAIDSIDIRAGYGEKI